MASAAGAESSFGSSVPAWRVRRLRAVLRDVEAQAAAGISSEGPEHRAIQRCRARVAARKLEGAAIIPGKRRAISAAEQRIIWTAIVRYRGSVSPIGDTPRGGQVEAWREACAKCRAARLPMPSKSTVHSWFNYRAAPAGILENSVPSPAIASMPEAGAPQFYGPNPYTGMAFRPDVSVEELRLARARREGALSALLQAATLCDRIVGEIERAHPGREAGSVGKVGLDLAAVARCCSEAITAAAHAIESKPHG